MTVTVTDPKATAQAAEIRRLLATGTPLHLVAAAVGCAIARVQQVQATAPTDAPVPSPRHPDRPRAKTPAPAGHGGLLAQAAAHDDPRIHRLAAHITADLDTLAALLALAADRERAARALVAADRRAEKLRAAHDARHPQRRRTDRQEATE